MPPQLWSGEKSRRIVSRVVIEGNLVLQTPAHFGNGDTDELTDMPLLVDPLSGKRPLLTGASIAGALRSYLREREVGYGQPADADSESVRLFGSLKGDDDGEQSPLIADDALGENATVETRHGVRIRGDSRTAEEDKLFDLRLWQAGAAFPLRFELVIRENDDAGRLKRSLATALGGLQNGSITLGARKRRGYGRANVASWRVKTYVLTDPDGLLDWIEHGGDPLNNSTRPQPDIGSALGVASLLDDQRQSFEMTAMFSLDGSLLVRSGGGQDDEGPDTVHLSSKANGSSMPVLPGTSLAGALRARAVKIAATLGDQHKAPALIDKMFGCEVTAGGQPRASRLIVEETVIQNARTDLVQSRVSIDRFTGGARETALFNEQPAFGGNDTTVSVEVRLVNPQVHEVGLLLLLLKDLWTGDLPLGGESSVGRGRLKGKAARLVLRNGGEPKVWEISARGQGLTVEGDRKALEDFVAALVKELKAVATE